MFFLIVENIVSCALIALVVTVILIFICGMLPRWIAPNFSYKPLHYGILVLASIILFVQVFLFTGAGYIKDYVTKAEEGVVSVKELLEEYPSITEYTDTYVSAEEVQGQIHETLEPILQYFSSYMWKRAIWAIVTIVLLIVFSIYQVNVQGSKGSSNTNRRNTTTRRRREYDF